MIKEYKRISRLAHNKYGCRANNVATTNDVRPVHIFWAKCQKNGNCSEAADDGKCTGEEYRVIE